MLIPGRPAYVRQVSDSLALALKRAVRAERSRRGMSQTELANALGWSQSRVASLETGTRRLYADELPEVCAALGVPLTRLLADAKKGDMQRLGLA
ncbi:helix-turn-helix domain-containing protein [Kineosporia rhizophila]|uniref:helix-turn-helix domain-containing protein n=1 Tax=Kineosporia rhizophila TaxID=84633 RepID=UPI0038CC0B04